MARILVAEKNSTFTDLALSLITGGDDVVIEPNWREAMSEIRKGGIDAVVLDSVFQSDNTGDMFGPAKEVVAVAQEMHVPKIIIASTTLPGASDGFPEGVDLVDSLQDNFERDIMSILNRQS